MAISRYRIQFLASLFPLPHELHRSIRFDFDCLSIPDISLDALPQPTLLGPHDFPREKLLVMAAGARLDLPAGSPLARHANHVGQRQDLCQYGRAAALARHPPGHQATQEL